MEVYAGLFFENLERIVSGLSSRSLAAVVHAFFALSDAIAQGKLPFLNRPVTIVYSCSPVGEMVAVFSERALRSCISCIATWCNVRIFTAASLNNMFPVFANSCSSSRASCSCSGK